MCLLPSLDTLKQRIDFVQPVLRPLFFPMSSLADLSARRVQKHERTQDLVVSKNTNGGKTGGRRSCRELFREAERVHRDRELDDQGMIADFRSRFPDLAGVVIVRDREDAELDFGPRTDML